MKTTKIVLLVLFLVVSAATSWAQTIRPLLTEKPNAVFVNVGLNQAVFAVTVGYQRQLSAHYQVIMGVDAAAVPKFFTNNKLYMGLQRNLVSSGHFVLPMRVLGSIILADNPLYRATNVSAELSLHPQLHFSRWTYGLDVSYQQGLATHLKHSVSYIKLAYAEAKDGWYQYPAATFRIGGSFAHSFNKVEIGLKGGYQANGKYDLFVPPYYALLINNFRF